jgi:cytochrome c
MSFELNKLLCAFFSALLLYLLASFVSELLYHKESKKDQKLSYYVNDAISKNQESSSAKEDIVVPKVTKNQIDTLLKTANLEKGESFVTKNCVSCHDINLPIKNKIGPSLAIVLNREIGSLADYKYSKTLKNLKKDWDILNLYLFLENPKEWAPGTKMSYRGITNTEKLLNTVKFLSENSIKNEN